MKRKLSPPPLRPSSKLGVPDCSSSESLRAQCGEDVVGRRKSGPTVYRATSGRFRVYKRNNEQLIDASLFLFFVDPLLD